MKTSSSQYLLAFGVFAVSALAVFWTMSWTMSGTGILLKSTPYQMRDAVSDADLARLTNGAGAGILDSVIARVKAKAESKWGSPMDVSAYNAYLDKYLALVDQLDDTTRTQVGPEYAFLFKYIYPRVYELRKIDTASQTANVVAQFGNLVTEAENGAGTASADARANVKSFMQANISDIDVILSAMIVAKADPALVASVAQELGYGNITEQMVSDHTNANLASYMADASGKLAAKWAKPTQAQVDDFKAVFGKGSKVVATAAERGAANGQIPAGSGNDSKTPTVTSFKTRNYFSGGAPYALLTWSVSNNPSYCIATESANAGWKGTKLIPSTATSYSQLLNLFDFLSSGSVTLSIACTNAFWTGPAASLTLNYDEIKGKETAKDMHMLGPYRTYRSTIRETNPDLRDVDNFTQGGEGDPFYRYGWILADRDTKICKTRLFSVGNRYLSFVSPMVSDSPEGVCSGDGDYEFLRDVPRVSFYKSGEFSPLGAPDPRYSQERSRFMSPVIGSYWPNVSGSFKNAVAFDWLLKNGYGEEAITGLAISMTVLTSSDDLWYNKNPKESPLARLTAISTSPNTVTLTWSATNNPISCMASNGVTGWAWLKSVKQNGETTQTLTVSEPGSYVFELFCGNSNGKNGNATSATVTVNGANLATAEAKSVEILTDPRSSGYSEVYQNADYLEKEKYYWQNWPQFSHIVGKSTGISTSKNQKLTFRVEKLTGWVAKRAVRGDRCVPVAEYTAQVNLDGSWNAFITTGTRTLGTYPEDSLESGEYNLIVSHDWKDIATKKMTLWGGTPLNNSGTWYHTCNY